MHLPESNATTRWSQLPEATPSAALRTRVLDAMAREPAARRASLMVATAAVAGIAASFLFALNIAQRAPFAPPDRAAAALSAQGVEFVRPAVAHGGAEVSAVADGSAAARVGLKPGDRLTALDRGAGGNMLNLAVAREGRTLYLAIPVPRAGMLRPAARRQSQRLPAQNVARPASRALAVQRAVGATPAPLMPSFHFKAIPGVLT